ncbi:DNA adenine methylase [Agromyces seonyuensis]|uniref:site-specific DNA-methyltransferase (adenine-specific) n=1 Tax=Agromyces seonyuensis TaxID=2662446 RepID=A0A6I4NT24_9MICO|nr:DNA adenine methylase [Agromyces seonyuensis]MWB97350.1 DNA methyltransferase [Agromyces seonyuensis]
MIKYLGSKRTMVPVLGRIAEAVEARSAVDLFTGTTRVAQEFKRRGLEVTAVDVASYSRVLAECFIALDAADVDLDEVASALDELNALPGRAGYVTAHFSEDARFFQPQNARRIDAVRDRIEAVYAGTALHPVLLSALLLAADRVDSTTGVQMAYLKQWAPRSARDLELRMPELLPGAGVAIQGDATELAAALPRTDLLYLDPPYNQHRYFTNYHVWETLVRWDAPEPYGVARKRLDARDPSTASVFNRKRQMPGALRRVILDARADTVVLSYNDESWVGADDLRRALLDAGHEHVELLEFDAKRYVGAQIGIHNQAGEKVGTVSHLRNTEYLFIAGSRERVETAVAAAAATPATTSALRLRRAEPSAIA